ncbi:MAG: zinc ribbon domain-containing protein [Treponema sp.]|nr:zinc ribbon domain-containing protein [Candidatus Treponema equifaecale]
MSDFLKTEELSEDLQKSDSKSSVVRFCTNCGSRLEEGDLFCVECGAKVEAEYEAENASEEFASLNEKTENSAEIEKATIKISPDRLNAITEGRKEYKSSFRNDLKNFTGEDIISKVVPLWNTTEKNSKNLEIQKEFEEKKDKNKRLLGYYVHKDSRMTEYIVIKHIEGNQVSGIISDRFTNGGYGTEYFSGTLNDELLNLRIVSTDLHPPAMIIRNFWEKNSFVTEKETFSITADYSFSGIICDGKISGTWNRANGTSKFLTYIKK